MDYTTFTDSTGKTTTLSLRFHRESRIRYRASGLEELMADDWALLRRFISHHKLRQRPRIQELLDYATGDNHDVLELARRKSKDMADKRAVHNYGRMISKFKTGYLVGNPIRVDYDGDDDSDEATNEVLRQVAVRNSFDDLNRKLVRDLSQVGRAYELAYRGQDDVTHVKRIDPRGTFIIYDNSLDDNSVVGVRYYKASIFDTGQTMAEVYTPTEIITLDYSDDMREVSRSPHAFGTVPITEYWNNDEGLGDYETELYLIDLYDNAESDTANHLTDMADAILAIYGDIEAPKGQNLADMKRARVMQLKPPRSADGTAGTVDAEYLVKSYDVTGVEAYKTRINKDIHAFTNTPDMSDENFSGNTSGEALKYKLFGLDQDRIDTQTQFEKGLRRRYKLIARVSQLLQEIREFDVTRLSFVFTPNLPKSLQEQVSVLTGLGGQVSQETALNLSGLVESPAREIEKLADERGTVSTQSDAGGYSSAFADQVGDYTTGDESDDTEQTTATDEG